jgi:uncharacterized secreted protein with C-terminal beta-propeller domain
VFAQGERPTTKTLTIISTLDVPTQAFSVSVFVVGLSPCANTFYRKDRIQLY